MFTEKIQAYKKENKTTHNPATQRCLLLALLVYFPADSSPLVDTCVCDNTGSCDVVVKASGTLKNPLYFLQPCMFFQVA